MCFFMVFSFPVSETSLGTLSFLSPPVKPVADPFRHAWLKSGGELNRPAFDYAYTLSPVPAKSPGSSTSHGRNDEKNTESTS